MNSTVFLNPKEFTPQLFIAIGETGAFFTLRETYLHTVYTPAEGAMGGCILNGVYQGTVSYEVRSFHHFNLSQNAASALRRARKYAKEVGLKLTANERELEQEMRDIDRRTSEQVEAAALARREQTASRNLHHAEDRDAFLFNSITKAGGVNHLRFGKYEGYSIAEVSKFDRGYLEYLLESTDTDGRYDNSLLIAQIELVLSRLSPIPESEYFGTIGERQNGIEATVSRVHHYYNDWGHGTIVTLTTDAGNVLILFTSVDMGDVGDRVRFNAKIEEHSTYNGVRQTTLKRPTKVEAL